MASPETYHIPSSNWKHIFFCGPKHHELHLRMAREIFGGDLICTGKTDGCSYNDIRSIDGEKVIWFFANIYEKILPHLRGKAIYIPHGLGSKPHVFKVPHRVTLCRDYFDQIWLTGALQAPEFYWSDIPREKLVEIGYTPLFYLPRIPERPRSVFISCGWFAELTPYIRMLRFLERFPETLDVYVSTHPSMPAEKQVAIAALCTRKGFTFVDAEEEMMRLYVYCQRAIVGLSSTATPFFYQNKPVIFLKVRNHLPFFQWFRLRSWIKLPLFHEVLSQSTRFLDTDIITEEMVLNAKPAPSSRKLFFSNNWNQAETRKLMITAYQKLISE